jgi:hypothetical protein
MPLKPGELRCGQGGSQDRNHQRSQDEAADRENKASVFAAAAFTPADALPPSIAPARYNRPAIVFPGKPPSESAGYPDRRPLSIRLLIFSLF